VKLRDRIALVTGGGRGIGRGIAVTLATEGADVVIGDVDRRGATVVAREVEARGRRALACSLDVTRRASVAAAVAQTLDAFGRLDVLVNNAGIIRLSPVVSMRQADWDAVLAVNLTGVFRCCRAVAPHMVARREGKIVNVASNAGKRGWANGAHYVASKFGVIGFTQSLAAELAPYHVNVNAVCPGVVDTAMWREVLAPARAARTGVPVDDAFAEVVRGIPLGRPQTPADVGHLVAFLASEEARNITGQAIAVNGGTVFS
jgi:NAD(P)-dependent dehydrogenase (short-subunit alcohol dehydrogenase family)